MSYEERSELTGKEKLSKSDETSVIRAVLPKEERYLQLIVNSENALSLDEICEELEISKVTLWRYRKRLSEKMVQAAKDLARNMAISMIHHLRKNAENGDTTAAVKILEIGEVYTPKQITKTTGVNVGIVVLPERDVKELKDKNGQVMLPEMEVAADE